MAIFYLETKPIKRSEGRSSVAASAYRAGVSLVDERTGLKHNYEKKGKNGVVNKDCFMYQDGQKIQLDRGELWNTAEKAEKRKDGRTGRDFIANLPFELNPKQRETIVREFSETIAKRYKVAIDWAIHLPDKKGDNRNHHAHILITTRHAKFENGQIVLGDKTILEKENKELKKQGLPLTQDQIKTIRKDWEIITNNHLALAGIEERIDCRSYREQGVYKLPTVKLGARASENERNGIATRKGDYNRLVEKANAEQWQGTMQEYIEKTIYNLEQEILVESRLQTSPTPPELQGQPPKPSIGKPSKPKLSLEEKMARWEQKQERERWIDERGEQALSKFEQKMQQHEQRLAEKAEQERLAQLEQQRQAELAEQSRLVQLEQQQQAEQARLAEIAREQQEYENRNSRRFSP